MATSKGSWEKGTGTSAATTAVYKIDGKTVATVTGLPENYVLDDGDIEGIKVSESEDGKSGTFTFSNDGLGTSNVRLTNSSGYSYKLALGSKVSAPGFADITSTVSSGTLTVSGTLTKGYTLSSDGKTITYSAEKTNQTLATVSGLNKELVKNDEGKIGIVEGENFVEYITVADDGIGKITVLGDLALGNVDSKTGVFKNSSAIELKQYNGGKYTLAAGEEVSEYKINTTTVTVKQGTGSTTTATATVKGTMNAGYLFSADGKKFTYKSVEAGKEIDLATITGLNNSLTTETASEFIEVDADKATVSLSKDALTAKNVELTVKNDSGLKLALADDSDGDGKIGFEKGTSYWTTKTSSGKVTATYKVDVEKGWTLTSEKKITYTKEAKDSTAVVLATVSNLSTAAAVTTEKPPTIDGIKVTEQPTTDEEGNSVAGVIKLDSRVLGTSKVSVGAKENYKLDIDTTSDYKVATKLAADTEVWTTSTSSGAVTATYKLALPEYYEKAADGKSVSYTATSKGQTLATVKGLSADVKVAYIEATGSVGEDGETAVGKYVLVDSENHTAVEVTKEPTYDPETNKLVTDGEGSIKIYGNALNGTKPQSITVGAKEDYKLDINEDVEAVDGAVTAPQFTDPKWTRAKNSTTATLKATISTGYTLSSDKKTLVCTKPSNLTNPASETIFEVKNLAKAEEAMDNPEGIYFDSQTNTVTLTRAILGTSTSAVSVSKAGYTLRLAEVDGADFTVFDSMPKNAKYADKTLFGEDSNWEAVDVWRVNGTTASYVQVKPAHYKYDSASNTVKYYAEQTLKTYVTVTGLKNLSNIFKNGDNEADTLENISINTATKTITFEHTDCFANFDTSKGVAIDSKKSLGTYKFAFGDAVDYSNYLLQPDATKMSVNNSTVTVTGKMKVSDDNPTGVAWNITDTAITKVSASSSEETLATITGLKDGLKNGTGNNAGKIVYIGENDEEVDAGIEVDIETDADGNITDVIKLSDSNVLNKKTVTISGKAGYGLAIDSTKIPIPTENSVGWALDTTGDKTNSAELNQGTSAGYKVDEGGKSVSYSKADYKTNYTTVSGLSKDVFVDDTGALCAYDANGEIVIADLIADFDTEKENVTLPRELLGESAVTTSKGYKINLNTYDESYDPETDSYTAVKGTIWSIKPNSDNDTATAFLKAYTSGSWTKDSTGEKLTYTPATIGNTLATITGLKTTVTENDLKFDTETTENAEFGEENKTVYFIKLSEKALTNNVVIENNFDNIKAFYKEDPNIAYGLDLDDSVLENKRYTADTKWTATETGSGNNKTVSAVNYKVTTTAGYKVADDYQSINYKAKLDSSATIKGLVGLTKEQVESEEGFEGVTVEEETAKITLSSGIVDKAEKIELSGTTGKSYTFAQGDLDEPEPTGDTEWTYTKKDGTAVMKGQVTEGWTLSTNAKTFTHTAGSGAEQQELAKISNLAKNLTIEPDDDGNIEGIAFDAVEQTITLSANVLDTDKSKEVKLTSGNYTLALADSVLQEPKVEAAWSYKDSTATYKLVTRAYYVYDATKNIIKYVPEKDAGEVYAVIDGLDKNKLKTAYDKVTGTISGIVLDTENNTITLSEDVLGTANISFKTNANNYTLELAGSVPKTDDQVKEWQTSTNTANYKSYNQAYYTLKDNAIEYHKATTAQTLATVTGIAKNEDINDCFDAATKTLKLTADKLYGKDVTVNKSDYTLTLYTETDAEVEIAAHPDATDDEKEAIRAKIVGNPTIDEPEFTISKSKTAVLKSTVSEAGYTLDTAKNKIVYTAETADGKYNTLATISNINKDLTADNFSDEIYLDTEDNTKIILTSGALDSVTTSVTLGKDDLYTLALDGNDDAIPRHETKEEPSVVVNAKGTATYQLTIPAGFYVPENGNGKTIAYSKDETLVYATISGLKKNSSTWKIDVAKTYIPEVENGEESNKIYLSIFTKDEPSDDDDDWIEGESPVIELTPAEYKDDGTLKTEGTVKLLSKEIFDSSNKITLGKTDKYTLNCEAIAPEDFGSDGKWYINSTTATLKQGKTAGYVNPVSKSVTDYKTVSFQKEDANTQLAEIKGLDKTKLSKAYNSVTGSIDGITINNISSSNKEIQVDNEKLFGTANVSLTGSGYSFNNAGIEEPYSDGAKWDIKKGTATLRKTSYAGYTLNEAGNVFTYTAGKEKASLVAVSGLLSTLEEEELSATSATSPISIDMETNVITLKNKALTTTNVTYKSSDKTVYTFDFANDVAKAPVTVTEWISGTTATYKTYDKAYYTYASLKGGGDDKTKVNYVKPTTGTTHATVKGLKATNSFTFDKTTKAVKLTDDDLDGKSNVSVASGDAFTLDTTNIAVASLASHGSEQWSVKSGTAVYKAERSKGYVLSEDQKTLYFTSGDSSVKGYATVSGLASLTADTDMTKPDDNGVILLSNDVLTTKNVTLKTDSKDRGYTLNYEGAGASISSAEFSSVKSGAATLSAVISEGGYKLSTDKKTLIYTAASTKNKNNEFVAKGIATIKGVASTETALTGTPDLGKKEITLDGNQLSASVSIVSSNDNDFGFKFSNTFNNKALIGSAFSDTVTITGSGVSVTAGKGDDFVYFSKDSGNIFCYGSDEGKDIIADFDSTDKINLTKSTITAENIKIGDGDGDGGNNDDAIISLGKGSITLKDYARSNITVVDKNKKETTYVWDNGCYIAQIQNVSSNSNYMVGDSELSINPTNLTNQSGDVAYGGDDKK